LWKWWWVKSYIFVEMRMNFYYVNKNENMILVPVRCYSYLPCGTHILLPLTKLWPSFVTCYYNHTTHVRANFISFNFTHTSFFTCLILCRLPYSSMIPFIPHLDFRQILYKRQSHFLHITSYNFLPSSVGTWHSHSLTHIFMHEHSFWKG